MRWDQVTIGFDDVWGRIKKVEEEFGFGSALDASKFLFSIGFTLIRKSGDQIRKVGGGKSQTRYNAGSIDPEQNILTVMNVLSDQNPGVSGNETFEFLVTKGADWFERKLSEYQLLTLADTMKLLRES